MSEALSEAPRDVLRRLADGEEASLRSVMTPGRRPDQTGEPAGGGLDRRTAALVQLAALVAVGAPTASLQWTVERASAQGVTDDALVGVLVAAAQATGAVQVVSCAPRLALALGFDTEVDAPDET